MALSFYPKTRNQPNIEFTNMNSYYDGLRENSFTTNIMKLESQNRLPYDMPVCATITTGWINFRMRGML